MATAAPGSPVARRYSSTTASIAAVSTAGAGVAAAEVNDAMTAATPDTINILMVTS
jgi:hypothetical protein